MLHRILSSGPTATQEAIHEATDDGRNGNTKFHGIRMPKGSRLGIRLTWSWFGAIPMLIAIRFIFPPLVP